MATNMLYGAVLIHCAIAMWMYGAVYDDLGNDLWERISDSVNVFYFALLLILTAVISLAWPLRALQYVAMHSPTHVIEFREHLYNFTNTNFFCCFAQSVTRARYGSVYNLYLTTLHAYTNPSYISAVPLGFVND